MASIKAIIAESFVARSTSLLPKRSSDSDSDSDSDSSLNPTMIDLLIALMVLIFFSLVLVAALYIVRKVRRSRLHKHQSLPQYEPHSKHRSHQRRLTISTSPNGTRKSSIYIDYEKHHGESSPCLSPDNIPEIHITFPDEHDEDGTRKSGRVVVVRVGEHGNVGLEPLKEDQLPAYQKESGERFQSLDLDRMGGLKEKEEYA